MVRSNSSDNPDRKLTRKQQAGGSMRSASTIRRLKMYKGPGLIHDRDGRVVDGDLLSKKKSGNKVVEGMARIAPNRRWFGNTRLIGAKELDEFRKEMGTRVADPYSVVLKRKELPMGLLTTAGASSSSSSSSANGNAPRPKILDADPFAKTFGPNARRKRPNLSALSSVEELAKRARELEENYEAKVNSTSLATTTTTTTSKKTSPEDLGEFDVSDKEGITRLKRERVFEKGQSNRIWTELYKVLDCSDVVIQVLDARDPLGTRSLRVEQHLRKNASHKHLILVLNKVDLVPTWVTKKWVRHLSKEYPTLAFHASVTKPFGKGSLIQLLRQFALLHQDKKQISVGIIGYPNVGKSAIINTLSGQEVSKSSPIPGETKVWQFVTLFKRVYLIDCPGVVYETNDSEADKVFKGVVRAEKIDAPEEYIPDVLERIRGEYLQRTYDLEPENLASPETFLAALAKRRGRLLKGGEPDLHTVAQQVLFDIQRGKVPYFVPPPSTSTGASKTRANDEAEDDDEEEEMGDIVINVVRESGKGSNVADFPVDDEEEDEGDQREEEEDEDPDEMLEAQEARARDNNKKKRRKSSNTASSSSVAKKAEKKKAHAIPSTIRIERQNFEDLPQFKFDAKTKSASTAWDDLDLVDDDDDE